MRKILLALGLLASGLLQASAITDGFACEGKTIILEDKFQDDGGGWEPDKALRFGPSGLTVQLEPNWTIYRKLNAAFLVKDADLCLEANFPKKIENNPGIGLRFWIVDYDNYYLFQINADGKAALYRMSSAKWFPIYAQDAPAIKKEPGAANHLRVTTKGNSISAYVNGQKVRDQRAQPPAAESRFGFYLEVAKATSSADGRTFNLRGYKVTEFP